MPPAYARTLCGILSTSGMSPPSVIGQLRWELWLDERDYSLLGPTQNCTIARLASWAADVTAEATQLGPTPFRRAVHTPRSIPE
jgi:hypothetical protein